MAWDETETGQEVVSAWAYYQFVLEYVLPTQWAVLDLLAYEDI